MGKLCFCFAKEIWYAYQSLSKALCLCHWLVFLSALAKDAFFLVETILQRCSKFWQHMAFWVSSPKRDIYICPAGLRECYWRWKQHRNRRKEEEWQEVLSLGHDKAVIFMIVLQLYIEKRVLPWESPLLPLQQSFTHLQFPMHNNCSFSLFFFHIIFAFSRTLYKNTYSTCLMWLLLLNFSMIFRSTHSTFIIFRSQLTYHKNDY